MKFRFLSLGLLTALGASAQLFVGEGATFFIGENATVTVQGSLTSLANIQAGGSGATRGKILLNGSALQNVNTNGNIIPHLEVNNANHVALAGNTRVSDRLQFTNGKIQLGTSNFIIEATTSIVDAQAGRFLETNGSGSVNMLLSADASDRDIPVGNGNNYTPFRFTNTGSSYGAGAFVAVRSTGAAVPIPTRHPRTESYINTAWTIAKNNITGGTMTARGTYIDGIVTGTEGDMRSFFHNGVTWSLLGGVDAGNNYVSGTIPGNSGNLFAMNRFVLVSPKAILQGAFEAGTGLMKDNLRTGGHLPASDPYRGATYSASFPHVNNAQPETVLAGVFNNQANASNDIVDWVFIELRDNGTPTTVQQTRAALVQRDGDIVDIDGVSPVYFKNVDPASFNILVRHRNHLGQFSSSPIALGLNAVSKNFTTSLAESYTNPSVTTNQAAINITGDFGSIWAMFAGNANGDRFTRRSGVAGINDYLILLNNLNNTAGYHRTDFTLNGTATTGGLIPVNDYLRLLAATVSGFVVEQHDK